jgi:D-galactarolactone cycloisomerase
VGCGVGLATALQLLAVLPHSPPRRAPLEPILEFDRSEHPFRQAVLMAPLEHDAGIVAIPESPGLGVEVDREAVARFTVAA